MTLQQLKYVVTVAEKGTLSDAAKELFVSQPALTKAIKELEDEMNITIFNRTNKGVIVSLEGDRFLGYARQVLEQTDLLEEEYKKGNSIYNLSQLARLLNVSRPYLYKKLKEIEK